jgi:hypothetical protein
VHGRLRARKGIAMTSESAPQEITLHTAQGTYLVQRVGTELRVGKSVGDTVLWQDETVPVDSLPEKARAGLDKGDTQSTDVTLALEAVVDAFAQRGG